MRLKRIPNNAGAATTRPGYTNANGQVVVRRTGVRSAVRVGQTVYGVRCGGCGLEYGVAGVDVKDRRCPGCQGGATGEALGHAERGPGLFGTE